MQRNDQIKDAETAYLNGNSDIAKRILDDYSKVTLEEIEEYHYLIEPKNRKQRILDTYKYSGLTIPEDIL